MVKALPIRKNYGKIASFYHLELPFLGTSIEGMRIIKTMGEVDPKG
jgi:hypothetical protein